MTTPYRFKKQNLMPPGGAYFFTVPETGVFFQSRVSINDLIQQLRGHYDANGLTLPENMPVVIQDYICRNIPEGFCDGGDGVASKAKRLDFFSILKFTEVLWNRLRTSISKQDFFVSYDEACRRARICIECPMNARHICSTCTGLREIAAKFIANRKTPYDGWLGACVDCGCVLSSKIHVAKQYLAGDVTEDTPANCWLKEK